ncbi:MAG: modified peptide precursor CbpA [Chthoniobacteraceae bacterium]
MNPQDSLGDPRRCVASSHVLPPFCAPALSGDNQEEGGENHLKTEKSSKKKEVIAIRKSCKVTGTGLSHYVMMEAPKK